MRALLPCFVLLLACHSSSSSSPAQTPDAPFDAPAQNECAGQGFMCQTQAGCTAGYIEVDDLFCGGSNQYCCAMIVSSDGGPDAAPDVVALDAPLDVAENTATEGGPPQGDGSADAHGD